MVMAFYGWYCWRKSNLVKNDLSDTVNAKIRINTWHTQTHVKVIILLTVLSIITGKLMATYTPTHFPYFDAATTIFAVFATYLVTQKVLENWLYWIVIDFVSIYLYVQKGLTPTAVLFFLYVGLATFGYFQWRKEYKTQQENDFRLS